MRYVIKHAGENHTMISSNVPCTHLTWVMFLSLTVNQTKR